MPQMAPMQWLSLFILFSALYLVLVNKISYNTSMNLKSTNAPTSYSGPNKPTWMW